MLNRMENKEPLLDNAFLCHGVPMFRLYLTIRRIPNAPRLIYLNNGRKVHVVSSIICGKKHYIQNDSNEGYVNVDFKVE